MRIKMSKAKQNPAGTWTIRVRWTTELGERHEHTVTCDTKWETEAKAAEYAQKKQQLSGGNPPFLEYLRHYVDMRKRALTNPNSQLGWEQSYQKAADFFTPQEKIQDITPTRYKDFLYTIGRSYAKSSNKSINYRLKRAFEDAKNRHMIDLNPAIGVHTRDITGVKIREHQPKHPLNIAQSKQLIQYLLNHTDKPGHVKNAKDKSYESGNLLAILTAILTGIREGEIAGLRWEDLDPKNHTIHVTHQVDSGHGHTVDEFLDESRTFDQRMAGGTSQRVSAFKGLNIIRPTKTQGSNRDVVVPDLVFEQLKRAKYDGETKESPIFKTRTYRTIGRSNLSYKLHYVLHEIGIEPEGYHFHNLRGTHVALLLKDGVRISTISKQLGHSSIDMTLKRYAYEVDEAEQEDSKKIYKGLGRLVDGNGKQKSKEK